ncbi:T9SS type B sorting domain-containing protein [Flavobacterium channae]|uniref:T9SS type B sorting domain-containing protein n=1 Tax=Flavobacterium channae TaxID=2897181 RepID=UPI001E46BF7A|nr:gliding motility-associated C-terminal domain-containing protein [Flavobacterium channae]UGS23876.1 gliding motility-associated C-terminal domain-containing protein [Flavobacterium channae]
MKKLLLFFMSFFTFFAFGQLSEGFEGATFPPTGWVVTDNGVGTVQSWSRNTLLPNVWTFGTASAMSTREGSVPGLAQDWLITPQVNVPLNGQVRFFARSVTNGEQGSVYKVMLSTTTQNITDFTVTLGTYTELEIINDLMQQKFINLDAYANQNVYIAFVHEVTNGLGDRWILDKVNVDRQCLQPDNLTVSAIGDTSVNLSWSNPTGASLWEVEYGPTGFAQGTGTLVTGITSNNPYTLNGLTAATTYDFYVRAICGEDNPSPWSDSETFTTALCAASQQCDFVFRMTDSWGDGWNGNTMTVRQFGQTVAVIGSTFTAGAGPVNVTVALCSGQPFELFWNTGGGFANEVGVSIIDPLGVQIYNKPFNTGTQGTVLYSGPALCTPPTCPAPSNIVVSALTTSSGTVTWTDNAGATEWQIIIQPIGTGYPPNGAAVTATVYGVPTYDFSGFPSATQYEVYVRAICDPTDSSIWAGPRNFATLISNDECSTAIPVPVNTGTACINSVDGTVLGATASPNPNSCGGTDDDDVWFQFIATETTHTISLVNVTGSTTDLYHVVYTGSCGSLTQLYCSDPESSVASNLIPGQTYYIRVYSFTGTAGQNTSFTLCVGTPVDCSDASAFCGETGLVYTNSVGVPSYGSIGCLSTSPNPSWYFMQVSQSGNLNFQISQTNSATGAGIDVDYIIWGPFTPAQFATSCNSIYDFPDGNTTIPNNIASCSYSAAAIENFTIANAVVNNIYIVLITNFSNQPGTVTFTQTNLNGTGAGATNCAIVCSNNLGADQTLCADSYQIVSSNTTADQYQWFFNNTLIPGETASTLTVYQSGTYKCIVTCGINNVEDEIVVTLNPTIVPTFSTPGAICSGAANVPLSNTSINGVTGQWTLAGNPVTEISTATAGMFTYIFTPNAATFPCSPNFQMDVEILGTCTFNSFATAVWVENCTNTATDGEFYNVTGVGADLIGPSANVFPGSDLGVYVQNSGSLIFRGAELKSFKTATSNVCSARLNYRIYQASTAPGAFTVLNLPLFDDCSGGTFPTGGGTCNTGDQKWQEVLNDAESPLDLTNYPPGDYVIEVFFDLTGDNDSTVDCDDTILVNNGGSNYIANFTIQAVPTFASTNEACGSSNATITVSGFVPGETYSVTYTDDTVLVGPTNYIANSSGQIILAGLNAGTYADFNFQVNGCAILAPAPIVITNFSPSITQVTSNTEICVGDNAVFTIEGSPNFTVSYTINGGSAQTTTLNASGLATITVTNPTAGNVVLQLINIFNTSCSIPVTNSSSVLVNALPTATLNVVDSNICLGVGNAEFVITGTPNATVSYTVNGGTTQTINIDATGSVTLTMNLPTADITVELTGVSLGICSNSTAGQTGTVVVTSIPVPVINITQTPVCADPTASFTVTSPVNTQLNTPTDLFISEITDHTSGALTYVEIYNGTGNAVDLANYKLKVYTAAVGPATCDLALSGILANDDVVVVKLSSAANQGGVVPDLSFTTCNGVNNNDNIVLTTSADVALDNWGVNQVVFTPGGGVGYNYRRLTSAVLPTMTWNPADWNVIDWTNTAPNLPDYSDVGFYSLYVTNYQYTLSDGTTTTTQTGVNFTGVAPGTYTLVATDLITGCSSNPLTFTINPVVYTNPVTTISYTTPVCISDATNPSPNTSAAGFATGGTYSSTPGLSIDPSTGVIDLALSTPGTYVVTYAVTVNATNCTNAGSSTATIVITPNNPSTFTNITDVCEGTSAALPTTSIEGYTGTWSPATIDTSIIGTSTYTFTPNAGQCAAVGTILVTIDDRSTPTFTQIDDLCLGAIVPLPTASNEGVTGTWSPAVIATNAIGVFTYTFTPDVTFCADVVTMDIAVIGCEIPKGISPNGDGENDSWDLSGYDIKKVEIFNRYGTKVYSKSNYSNEWFGQSDSGNELPDATYYYVIEFNDLPAKTGWVYINRQQ